jgi:hypothetical protein
VFGAALAGGVAAAVFYQRLGLTLSHYDARGHLIVARRIVDNLTPGGAIGNLAPLPHLLNAIPVQIDAFYRSGASAVAISIVSYALAAAAIAWIVLSLTESVPAALAAALVFALNANVVYLQATPMTEPLLLGLTALGVAMLLEWTASRGPAESEDDSRPVGVVLALACLTRYEAWPVTYAALAAAVWARWRGGEPWRRACRRVGSIAAYPSVALVAFAIFSRVVVGRWFVSSDFFVPENKALGLPVAAAGEIIWGVTALSGRLIVGLAAAGALMLIVSGLSARSRARFLIPVALCATAAVPWSAFLDGHPFRIRYMVPLIAFEAVAAGHWPARQAGGYGALILSDAPPTSR